jgi:hypothetical protein
VSDLANEENILIVILIILIDWLGVCHESRTLFSLIAERFSQMRVLFLAPVDHVANHATGFALRALFA